MTTKDSETGGPVTSDGLPVGLPAALPAGAAAALAPTPEALAEAQRFTRQLARTHYENFPVLTVFVPKRLRQHFANVYAFCRWADDLADETGRPEAALAALETWQEQLLACYQGQMSHPIFVALRETIETFAIGPEPFLDLLSAFRQDQTTTRYASFGELENYCRRSANPVGRLVLLLCRRATEANLALSDDVCTGLQLINFWQDVALDAAKGRIYLPLDDCARFGVTEDEIFRGRHSLRLAELLDFETTRAEERLRRGRLLARRMPGRLKLVVGLFAEGGLALARRLRAGGFRVLEDRPVVSRADVVRGAATCLWRLTPLGSGSHRLGR